MDILEAELLLGRANHSTVPGRLKRGQRQSMQQQHLLLLHAHKCQQREAQAQADGQIWQCQLARCKKMKGILNHLMSCPSEKKCVCSTSRQLMKRLTQCKKDDCPVCVQRKEWQMNITSEQRRHIVDLLVQASRPDSTHGNTLANDETVLLSSTMMESDMYKLADTLSEYYRMLGAKKWKLEMDIEDRKHREESYQLRWQILQQRMEENWQINNFRLNR